MAGESGQDHRTNADFLGALHLWTVGMVVLLIVFTPLAFTMGRGFLTVFGAAYLVSLAAAFIITIRMRQTVEAYHRVAPNIKIQTYEHLN